MVDNMNTDVFFYTNTLAPYMFHRWELMLKEFPKTKVFVTRKPDKGRPWNFKTNEMPFPCFYFPETIKLTYHFAISFGLFKFLLTQKNETRIHLLEDVSGLNTILLMMLFPNDKFYIINDGGFVSTTKRFGQKLRWNLVGKKCSGTMTPGNFGFRYMNAWGFPSRKIYNSYLSHDCVAFTKYFISKDAIGDRIKIRKSLGVQEGDLLLLCNSRLMDIKRIEDLQQAIEFLPEEVCDRLVVCLLGDGPYKEPLTILKEQKVVRFNWVPSVEYKEVKKYFNASDFMVLPSERDIWGLVVNESLSLGKPVICTDVIGASEMVVNGENGFKIPPRSPEILADCIKSLVLDTELRERLSKNALKINEKWNSNLFLDELKKMIYSTLNGTIN